MTDSSVQKTWRNGRGLGGASLPGVALFLRDEGSAELPVPSTANLRSLLDKEDFHAL